MTAPKKHRRKRKGKKKQVTTASVVRLQKHFQGGRVAHAKLKMDLREENDRLRETLAANKRRREARKTWNR